MAFSHFLCCLSQTLFDMKWRPLMKNWSRENRRKGLAFTGGKDEEKKIRWQKNGRSGQAHSRMFSCLRARTRKSQEKRE